MQPNALPGIESDDQREKGNPPQLSATRNIPPTFGTAETVTEETLSKFFGSGHDFDECLRQSFPMTSEEIEGDRGISGIPLGSEKNVHAAIARTRLRERGLYSKARLIYIEKKKAQCLKDAAELKMNGNWRNKRDATYHLMNEEHFGFAKVCEPLFDIRDDESIREEEQKQYEVFRRTILMPLRDQLDAIFAPLHAVMHLREVDKYLSNSRDGICGAGDHNVEPYNALRRLVSSLNKARKIHTDQGALQTYFSATINPDDAGHEKIETPQISFSEVEEKAKELAKILIRTSYRESQQRKTIPAKEVFVSNVAEGLRGTDFTLENCGFTVKDKTKGVLKWKKVTGYELVEQK